jgi:hypothetical protein
MEDRFDAAFKAFVLTNTKKKNCIFLEKISKAVI